LDFRPPCFRLIFAVAKRRCQVIGSFSGLVANPTVTVVIKSKSFTAFEAARTIDSLESERDRHFVGIPGPVKFSTTTVTVIKKDSTIESLIRERGKLTRQVFIRKAAVFKRSRSFTKETGDTR
jgi:hypothetical protein